MNQAFTLLSDFSMAQGQITLLVIGLIILLLGGLLLGSDIYWHLKGQKVNGRIAAVTVSGNGTGEMYYPLYEYKDAAGVTVRAEGDSGSNSLTSWLPGTPRRLYVHPHEPQHVTPAGGLWPCIGFILGMAGITLMYIGFTHFKFNIVTAVLILWLLIASGNKLRKIIKPKALRETKEQFMARKQAERASGRRELSESEICDRLRNRPRSGAIATPLVCLLAFAFIGLGVYLARNTAQLLATGARAAGQVVGMESSHSSSSYTYYPVVAFEAAGGQRTQFKDRMGSNPPSYSTGMKVTVIYDPANPQTASIDHGIGNWLGTMLSISGGAVLLLMAVSSARSQRRCDAFLSNHAAPSV
jgi:Protein of unknown function (DUF3592)